MAKGIRKNITVPGLLAAALRLRAREFRFRTLSPFIVDLVAFDLQSGSEHPITLAIARDTQAAQDAVDAELASRYRPHQQRAGLLVQVVQQLNELRMSARNDIPVAPLNAQPERITFPERIWQMVDLRWSELGYSSLSAYVTGLIRYDLLIGGPHRSLPPANRANQDLVARETFARRRQGRRRKLYLDHLIEETEGRPLQAGELEAIKTKIAQTLQELFSKK